MKKAITCKPSRTLSSSPNPGHIYIVGKVFTREIQRSRYRSTAWSFRGEREEIPRGTPPAEMNIAKALNLIWSHFIVTLYPMDILPQFGAGYGSGWSGLKVKRSVFLVGLAELAWFLGGMGL